MIHTIKQPDIDSQTNPSLYWASVERETRNILSIENGDQVNFHSGELVGFVVDNLSDFRYPFTKDICIKLIAESSTELMILKRPIRNEIPSNSPRAYSVRRVIDTKGRCSEQVLINAYGCPTWINVGHDQVVVKLPN